VDATVAREVPSRVELDEKRVALDVRDHGEVAKGT
jgi:hypothetical protein